MLQPFYEEHLLDSSDYIDGVGYGHNQSQRQSVETDFLTVSSGSESRGGEGFGIGGLDMIGRDGSRSSENVGPSRNRTSVFVDPDQLESNAVYEHIRAGPQALPIAPEEPDSHENTLPTTTPADS
ncbi:hypothetical protein BGX20_009261 [Mortierella sp. AD010]|nr:hypothetical protein BGX20_009261 [Mortierella sp. AD010]